MSKNKPERTKDQLIKDNPYLSKDYAKRMKARKFKCETCKREFYVPCNVYTVKCPCGKIGYSEKTQN